MIEIKWSVDGVVAVGYANDDDAPDLLNWNETVLRW